MRFAAVLLVILPGLFLLGAAEPSAAQNFESVVTLRIDPATEHWDTGARLPGRRCTTNQSSISILACSALSLLSSEEVRIQQSTDAAVDARLRNTLTGAAIGAGVGTVVWLGVVCAMYCSGNSGDGMGVEVYVTPVFTGVGAILGGLTGYHRPVRSRNADSG